MRLSEKEYTMQEAFERGQHAAKLREDSMLVESHEIARELFIEQSIFGEDVATREAARAKVLALAEIRSVLDAIVSGGEYAGEVLRQREGT